MGLRGSEFWVIAILAQACPGSRALWSVGDLLIFLPPSANISHMWPFRSREFIHEHAMKETVTGRGMAWALG